MSLKKMIAVILAALLLLAAVPAMAEENTAVLIVDAQKLDASYTLALNAINKEDYETAKEYLDICFVFCDPQSNPTMYADLLLKRACIDVIEEKNDMALLLLDAALRVQPDLADAYLVLTQIYSTQGNADQAIANLEKYIELSQDTALYETVAQLHEANGNMSAAQEAYDKFVASAGADNQEAGFQAGLYRMENGKYAEAIEAFAPYTEDEVYCAGAWYNIGVCRMNMGDYASAAEAFDACQEKGGNFEGLYYNRGISHLLGEEWEKAAADFEQSIASEPYVNDSRYNMAVCLMQIEKYEDAAAAFTEVIAADEEYIAAYYFRGACNGALGNLEAALADYSICIDQGYELTQSYYQRAQIYAAMGDKENQASDLESSLKLVD